MTTNNKNTILVPVDFSDISMTTLEHAVQVAKHFDNNLALLHVIEEAFFASLFRFGDKEAEKENTRKEARIKLKELADHFTAKHGIECTTVVKIGKIYTEIAETATELGCDSIIMGSNGASGFEQIIGSNASKTIMHADVPVVVVKSNKQVNGYQNIVFPLDLSIESRQKVNWAIHLGKSYKATINILSYDVSDESDKVRHKASLNQVTRLLEESHIKFTVTVLDKIESDFSTETLNYAEKINADLILIMSQHETDGISDLLIGTEAQQIVNKSRIVPVMCIKPKPLGFANNFRV
jgi:nucleotide-binding universal stress UspA family protein